MTISGGRTEQLYIFCRVTVFTTDFLSFRVLEHIRFFHGALQVSIFTQSNNTHTSHTSYFAFSALTMGDYLSDQSEH